MPCNLVCQIHGLMILSCHCMSYKFLLMIWCSSAPTFTIWQQDLPHWFGYMICSYVMFLFSKQHEELVGIYASQLAPHRCIDLFVHMMEVKLNSRWNVLFDVLSFWRRKILPSWVQWCYWLVTLQLCNEHMVIIALKDRLRNWVYQKCSLIWGPHLKEGRFTS